MIGQHKQFQRDTFQCYKCNSQISVPKNLSFNVMFNMKFQQGQEYLIN